MDEMTGQWFEDDDFWRLTYPFMFPETRFAAAAEEIPGLIELSGCEGTSLSILDQCCGPGRHAIPLTGMGHAVTAIDRTALLLDRARQYAEREQVAVEFVQADMRRFRRPSTFDLALNLFTSFGYFADPGDNRLVLENVLASLKPGGVFVLDVLGKEIIARRFEPTGSTALPTGEVLIERRTVIDDWSRMRGEWLVVRDGVAKTFRLEHWLYSGQELKRLLERVGFTEIELYGSLDGAAYGPEAERLIAVARKI